MKMKETGLRWGGWFPRTPPRDPTMLRVILRQGGIFLCLNLFIRTEKTDNFKRLQY